MNKGYENNKKKSNEELVALFVNEGNQEAFEDLMKNTEGLRVSIAQKYNIPGMDFDDLLQEGAFEMYQKLSTYKSGKAQFTSFLYFVITNRYKNLLDSVTCEKRNLNEVYSMDEIESNAVFDSEGKGNSSGNILFSVECEDFKRVELIDLIEKLNLSEKERVVARFLIQDWSKSDIGRVSGMSNSAVCVLSKRIGKKMILAGAVV